MALQEQDPVRASYEAWWSRVRDALATEAAAGETNLSRLLHKIFAKTVGERHAKESISVLWGTEVPVPYQASNQIVRDWIADTVISQTAGVDAIIETGSGWGYNLFNIWLRGGPNVPYHAFEYTDAGRESALAVRKAAENGPHLNVHPFNYYEADFSAIKGRYDHVLVYSSHSIEQIGMLPESYPESVLSIAKKVTCIHFEPIGWQFAAENNHPIRDYGQLAYSQKHNYNKNLWELLKKYQAQGRLVIDETSADTMCVKAYNGTSVIRWHSLAD